MSVNNTVAVFDAVLGKKNEFLTNSKIWCSKEKDDWKDNAYNLPFSQVTLLEYSLAFMESWEFLLLYFQTILYLYQLLDFKQLDSFTLLT